MPINEMNDNKRYYELTLKTDIYIELYETVEKKAKTCLEEENVDGAGAYLDICKILLSELKNISEEMEAFKNELVAKLESLI